MAHIVSPVARMRTDWVGPHQATNTGPTGTTGRELACGPWKYCDIEGNCDHKCKHLDTPLVVVGGAWVGIGLWVVAVSGG